MYCSNCGNKIDEKAYACVHCGVIVNKNNGSTEKVNRVKKKNNNEMLTGILSIIFGSISLCFCLYGFVFGDISDVGMFVDAFDRILFSLKYNFVQLFFATFSFVLSLVNIKKKFNRIGLYLTLAAFFLIITEFVVILIY